MARRGEAASYTRRDAGFIREGATVLSILRRLSKCEGGATALEYMLIAALLGLAVLQVGFLQFSAPPVT